MEKESMDQAASHRESHPETYITDYIFEGRKAASDLTYAANHLPEDKAPLKEEMLSAAQRISEELHGISESVNRNFPKE